MSQPVASVAPRSAATGSERGLDRVIVALDTADREQFDAWCRFFGPRVAMLKVGLEAFVRWGPPAVATAREHGRAVFLDLKLHDIPNTVAGAVAAARALGVRLLTVHAGGGKEMLASAVEAAAGELGILAVTLLTHIDEATLTALDLPGDLSSRVERWATLSREAGCAGVVCSPREAGFLRPRCPAPFLLVTPGIRPAGVAAGDQRRVSTPAAAVAAGADYLVVGRALTAAADPASALVALERELTS